MLNGVGLFLIGGASMVLIKEVEHLRIERQKRYPKAKIAVTGHSLGGSLALTVGAKKHMSRNKKNLLCSTTSWVRSIMR